jgi:hypothetical protein
VASIGDEGAEERSRPLKREGGNMSPLEPDFLERCFLGVAGVGSVVFFAALFYRLTLAI